MKDLWVPLSGAIAQQRNVETIAQNVANANTAGYKKDILTFREYLTALEKGHSEDIDLPHKEWKPDDFYRSYGAENALTKIDRSYSIFEQGQLIPTKNPLDIAILGDAFFELLTPAGIRYSRKGTFSLSKEGYIINENGYFLLSEKSLPNNTTSPDEKTSDDPQSRKIKALTNQMINIDNNGTVFQNTSPIGNISLREFKNPHNIKKEGHSLFINSGDSNFKEKHSSIVQQGFIEQSNVNALEEMSNLIRANRNFESIQKVIKTYDSISGKVMNELTKF